MTWVVAYDVSLDRRRTRISKVLAAKGIRLQKSVFLVEGPTLSIAQLVHELAAEIDDATDRICAWPLIDAWQERQLCFPADAAPLQESFVIA